MSKCSVTSDANMWHTWYMSDARASGLRDLSLKKLLKVHKIA